MLFFEFEFCQEFEGIITFFDLEIQFRESFEKILQFLLEQSLEKGLLFRIQFLEFGWKSTQTANLNLARINTMRICSGSLLLPSLFSKTFKMAKILKNSIKLHIQQLISTTQRILSNRQLSQVHCIRMYTIRSHNMYRIIHYGDSSSTDTGYYTIKTPKLLKVITVGMYVRFTRHFTVTHMYILHSKTDRRTCTSSFSAQGRRRSSSHRYSIKGEQGRASEKNRSYTIYTGRSICTLRCVAPS